MSVSAVAPGGLAFESLSSLRPELLAGTHRLGYTALTDIQERALPPALAGRDVVGKAKTGSGKTVVFGLALLQRLDMKMSSAGRPQALVLSPTRELAQQLVGAVRGLAVGLDGTRVVAVTGGATSRDQRDAIAAGVHVVVGTPGRVLAMLDAGYMDPSALRTLVLDEADTLLNMGFEEEVHRIIKQLPGSASGGDAIGRQTLLFSATWPAKVETLSARVQSRPEVVSDGEGDGAGGAAAAQVDRSLLRQSALLLPAGTDRAAVLCAVLAARAGGGAVLGAHAQAKPETEPDAEVEAEVEAGPGLAVVFCETKQQCREVAARLQEDGAAALALHGDLEQRERDRVLVRFRNGSCRILVATNVAARGLDVAGIGLVVCYELSGGQGCGELHTHRVGRTARAESVGEALSLVCLADAKPRGGGRDGGGGGGRGGRGGGGRSGGRGGGGGSGRGSELGRLEAIEASLGGEKIPRVEWADAPENSNSAGAGRAGSPGAAGLAAGWSAEWRTLLVQGGRRDKLRPGDILGALTSSGSGPGLSGADVGTIEVTEQRTWVAVRSAAAAEAAAALGKTKIKKSKFKVHLIDEA